MKYFVYITSQEGLRLAGGPFNSEAEGQSFLASLGQEGYVLSEQELQELQNRQQTQNRPSTNYRQQPRREQPHSTRLHIQQHHSAPVHFIGKQGAYRRNRR